MKKMVSVVLALVMLLSLAVCGTSALAEGKKVVNIGLNGSVTDVSPFAQPNEIEYPIQNTMYQNLFVTANVSSQETIPVIGKSWEMIDDYTAAIEIYDYVHDVDGNPITADDVVFSYETCKAAASQTDTAYIDSIKATGAYTLEIKLTEPKKNTMIKLLTHIKIVNKAAYENNPETTPGTTAYKLTSYTSGSEYVFEKADNYWQTAELNSFDQQANVDKLVFQCIPEKTQMTTALENEEIQMAIGMDGREAARFEEGGEDTDGFAVDTNTGSFSLVLLLNCSKDSQCSDINLRNAILYGVDRDAIVKVVLNGAGVPGSDLVSNQLGGYNKDWLQEDYFKCNQDTAKEYLAKSSYKGEVIKLEAQSNYSAELEMMQAQLSAIGIKTEIQTFENALWQEEKVAGTGESSWDVCLDGVGGSLVTNAWKVKFNPSNFSTNMPQIGIQDDKLVELLNKAAETQDAADIEAFHDYLIEQAYAIGLYVPAAKTVTVDTITDICYNHMGFVVPASCNYSQYTITE